MSHSLTLGTAHGRFPDPLMILLAVAAIGYVLWSRMKGQPLEAKRLLVLPVVLIVIGITDITGSSAPHLTASDIAFLAIGVGIAVVLGAARGATMELYPNGGELWQRYRLVTVALWIALIAAKLVLAAIAGVSGASAGAGTNSLLLTLGVSLLAEAAIVALRALSRGVPSAADRKDSDGRQARDRPTQSSATERVVDVAESPKRPPSNRVDNRSSQPTPSRDASDRVETPQWRSPKVNDGVSWLHSQLQHPGGTSWNRRARSSGRDDDYRRDHHDHHDRNDHNRQDHNRRGRNGSS
jgi:hypothetical protein